MSVLLVDDRLENLYALEATLEPLGQRLVRARSARDMLHAVLHGPFAAIVIDLRVAARDGYETLSMMRSRQLTEHVPIIFLLDYAEQTDALRCYSAGVVDYLLKPFDPDALRTKVSVFVHLRQHELALAAARKELLATKEQLRDFLDTRTPV
ncbi:MAG: response regulator [Deltaproteobacteria bacterium]|nr:response regulator [Deltaproteobacteria bacterium]